MKILLFDIETSYNIGKCWGKYEQDIISFDKERTVICYAYKWLGKKKIMVDSINEMSEKKLAHKLHKLFDEADIIIAHNGDAFDIKMSNTFFVKYGLQPPSPYKTVDTLKIARSKFKFNSNKLDDLGHNLGIGRKLKHEGFALWEKCMAGDQKAWNKMIRYNKQDVVLLEKVYLILRAWANTVPNVLKENRVACPLCGSKKVQNRGWTMTKTFKKRRHQCQNCARWFDGERVNNPKI